MKRLTPLLLVVALAACSGPPPANPALDEARAMYESAAAQPEVTSASADYLDQAQSQLTTAETLRLDKAEVGLVDHHAFMARQLVRTAIVQSERVKAEAEIAEAEAERRQVQLEVRTAEADAARRRAEAAQREAETQRAAAEAERRRAEEAQRQAQTERTAAEEANRRAAEERASAEAARRDAAAALARAQELTSRIAELEAAQTERGLVLTLGDVLFDVGKAELKSGSYRAIEQLAQFLGEYPMRKVLIEGFTDSSGSDETNQALSQRRSDAVRTALLERGIAANRVRTIGYGEAFPRATNDNPAGRQLNRRVEVIISDDSGQIPERTQ